MERNYGQPVLVFNGAAATGVSLSVFVQDYTNISVAIHGNATANLTVKLVGSTRDFRGVPDFSAAASIANSWGYIQMIDLQNGATIAGNTGLVFTGAADDRNFEANVNALTWVALRITTYTAGAVSAYITPFSI